MATALWPRYLAPIVRVGMKESRVVAILGARQVGKSTMARELGGAVYSLDDPATFEAAQADPVEFVERLPRGAVIDEVQLVPQLFPAIKLAVDRDPTPGKLLLTGSANVLTLPRISESLAGRIQLYELMPLARAEVEGRDRNVVDMLFGFRDTWSRGGFPRADPLPWIVRGGFPEALRRRDEASRTSWFSNYVTTMMQRDIRDIARISDVAVMHRLLRLLCAWSGRMLNFARLASELQASQTTIRRYFDILEKAFLVYAIPAWTADAGRRLLKTPKLFAADSGLAAHEMNADYERLRTNRSVLGGLMETFVCGELRKHASWSRAQPSFYHYRDHSTQEEIDLLLETRAGVRVGIEIKASATLGTRDVATLMRLSEDKRLNLKRGIVFYTGDTPLPFGPRVWALPISLL